MITDNVIGDGNETEMTFEELSMIVRKEKSTGTLSDVRRDLYPAMSRLLDKQSRECERQIGIDIGSLASAAANERRKRILTSIKLIVEHRMSKVASLALRGAMGCVNSIDSLPQEERDYYNSVLIASQSHWALINRKKNVVQMGITEVVEKKEPPAVVSSDPVPAQRHSAQASEPASLKDMPVFPDDDEFMDDIGDIEFAEDDGVLPVTGDVQGGVVTDVPVSVPVGPGPAVDTASTEGTDVSPPVPVEISDDDVYDESLVTIYMLENVEEVLMGPSRDYRLRKGDVVRMPVGMASSLIYHNLAAKV